MLSQKAKYALKAMFLLAAKPDGQLTLIAEIAEHAQAPKKFLELILLDLKRHGLLYSQRGRHGGYALARPAARITVGEIMRIMDGPLAPLPCASFTRYRRCDDCRDEATCKVRQIMRHVRDEIAAVVDATTLADVVAAPEAGRLTPTLA